MKKFVRIIMFSLLGFVLLIGGIMYFTSEKIPTSQPSQDADLVAQNMMTALNKNGWDSLKYMTWVFKDVHTYVWDKQNNKALVLWDDYKVAINLNTVTGVVFKKEVMLTDTTDINNAVSKAWSYWCNDSFWMFAPFKVFDPGTSRSLVQEEGSAHGLMVKYDSGGVTPGDSYLWLLDENYQPTGYKMWVKIIPVGGTYFSWEDWISLPCGAKVATNHIKSGFELKMTGVKEANTLEDLGYPIDIFTNI